MRTRTDDTRQILDYRLAPHSQKRTLAKIIWFCTALILAGYAINELIHLN